MTLGRMSFTTLAGIPVIGIKQDGAVSITRFLKRVVDVTVSLGSLVLVAPLLVFIGLIIRLDSPGTVVFGQERVGK